MTYLTFPHIDSIISEEVDMGSAGIQILRLEIGHYVPVVAGMHEFDKYWVADVRRLEVKAVDGNRDPVLVANAQALVNSMLRNKKIQIEVEEILE